MKKPKKPAKPGELISKMNEKKKINPRGATVLVNLPTSKKKVALYGLI